MRCTKHPCIQLAKRYCNCFETKLWRLLCRTMHGRKLYSTEQLLCFKVALSGSYCGFYTSTILKARPITSEERWGCRKTPWHKPLQVICMTGNCTPTVVRSGQCAVTNPPWTGWDRNVVRKSENPVATERVISVTEYVRNSYSIT